MIFLELSQNTRKDFSDLLCLCPARMRTTHAFLGPLRRASSGTMTCPSLELLGLAVFERKLSLMSLCMGRLVSEQGVDAAFRLI